MDPQRLFIRESAHFMTTHTCMQTRYSCGGTPKPGVAIVLVTRQQSHWFGLVDTDALMSESAM
jgi:hypothetical protein